jgi:hypothetical protein
MLEFLEKVPAAFWVVVGAMISFTGTFLGIILTNRSHARRLREQHEHDREVKNRDREMSLRKEIYLAAAEAISTSLIAISRFSDLEIHHDKLIDKYLAKSAAIFKIHLIATEETVKAITVFSGDLDTTFFRLFTKRAPLLRQGHEIATLRSLADGCLKKESRTLELMKQHDIDGSKDQDKLKALQNNFDFEARYFQETYEKAHDLTSRLTPLNIQFMEECAEESVRLARLLVPVIVSIRNELDLPINESEYIKTLEESAAKQMDAVKKFAQEFQSFMSSLSSELKNIRRDS